MNEEHKDKRKKQLLQAAMEVFSSRGYAATRMDDIAQAASVSKGSVYNYFSSKQDLFYELFVYSISEDTENVIELFDSDVCSRDKIVGMVKIMIDRFRTDNCIGKLLMEYWATANLADSDDEFHQMIKQLYKTFQDLISNTLKQGHAAGELKLVAPPDISAKMLIALLDGMGLQLRLLGMGQEWSDEDFEEIVKTIESLLI